MNSKEVQLCGRQYNVLFYEGRVSFRFMKWLMNSFICCYLGIKIDKEVRPISNKTLFKTFNYLMVLI